MLFSHRLLGRGNELRCVLQDQSQLWLCHPLRVFLGWWELTALRLRTTSDFQQG